MAESSSIRSILPQSAAVFAIVVGAGYYYVHQPIGSSRPDADTGRAAAASGSDAIDARLWQDPFEAIEKAATAAIKDCSNADDEARAEALRSAKEQKKENADAIAAESFPLRDTTTCLTLQQRLLRQLRAGFRSCTVMGDCMRHSTLVLAVKVPSDPFGEGYETRMRERYAVNEALVHEGYGPTDPLHLSYLLDAIPNDEDDLPAAVFELPGAPRKFVRVPYEWFELTERDGGDYKGLPSRVLVLWMGGTREGNRSAARPVSTLMEKVRNYTESEDSLCEWTEGKNPESKPAPSAGPPGSAAAAAVANARGSAPGAPEPHSCVRIAVLGPTSSDEYASWLSDPIATYLTVGRVDVDTRAKNFTQCFQHDIPDDSVPLSPRRAIVNALRKCAAEHLGELAVEEPALPQLLASRTALLFAVFRGDPNARRAASYTVRRGIDSTLTSYLDDPLPRPKVNDAAMKCGEKVLEALSKRDEGAKQVLAKCLAAKFPKVDDSDAQWDESVAKEVLDHFQYPMHPDDDEELIEDDDAGGSDSAYLPNVPLVRATQPQVFLKLADRSIANGLKSLNIRYAGLRVFVNRATARSDSTKRSANANAENAQRMQEDIVPDDRATMKVLVEEMARRLAPACGPSSHRPVVLVLYEADTIYGRSLWKTFNASTSLLTGEKGACPGLKPISQPFLQGLDGEVPAQAGKEGGTANPLDMLPELARANNDSDTRRLAYPSGRSQLDRVSSLITAITIDEGLPPAVVLLLGSDVYDKLILARAVRSVAPYALLMTTDLDSRFMHESEYRFTRNLLVASGFPLQPPPASLPKSQKSRPTFRDSYQTSTFVSVAQALCEFQHDVSWCTRLGAPGRATVYEIGRTQPVPLLTLKDDSGHSDVQSALVPPDREIWAGVKALAALLIALAVIMSATHGSYRFVRLYSDRELLVITLVTFGALLLFIAVYWWWFFPRTSTDSAEPFFLLEGVSIWPSEVLRQVCMIIAVLAVVFMRHDLRTSNRDLAAQFAICRDEVEERSSVAGALRKFSIRSLASNLDAMRFIAINQWMSGIPATQGQTVSNASLPNVWRDYRRLGQRSLRVIRVISWVIVFLAGYIVLRLFAGEAINEPPARSAWNWLPFEGLRGAVVADHVALYACIVAALVCICFVIDATRLCAAFTRWVGVAVKEAAPPLTVGEMREALSILGERTRVVSRFIAYPFVLLLLLMISRSGFFDDWQWPVATIVALLLLGVYAVASAWGLRRACESARESFIDAIECRTQALAGEAARETDASRVLALQNQSAEMTLLEHWVRSYREGAFVEWFKNPLLRALIIPAGGAGVLTAVLEALTSG